MHGDAPHLLKMAEHLLTAEEYFGIYEPFYGVPQEVKKTLICILEPLTDSRC